MNKTKRTLIVSSVVMALVLVVTVVSVTAAWFTNTASSSQDGFTINSTTLEETASITIDDGDVDGANSTLWPAVIKQGVLAKGAIPPSGASLKNEGGDIIQKAKCAVFYFPLNFIGEPDTYKSGDEYGKTIDGRKALSLVVSSAKIGPIGGAPSDDAEDIKDDFNVEMCLVSVNKDTKQASEISLDGVYSDALKGTDSVFYHQRYTDGEPIDKSLYMLIVPGEEYYVKATIYFNKVDEEYDDLLYLRGKSVYITFKLESDVGDVDVRAFKQK